HHLDDLLHPGPAPVVRLHGPHPPRGYCSVDGERLDVPAQGRKVADVVLVEVSHGEVRLSFAKTSGGGQVVDLSVKTLALSERADQAPAPTASAPPRPCWRPSPPRPREPGFAPAARRLQANHRPAPTTPN